MRGPVSTVTPWRPAIREGSREPRREIRSRTMAVDPPSPPAKPVRPGRSNWPPAGVRPTLGSHLQPPRASSLAQTRKWRPPRCRHLAWTLHQRWTIHRGSRATVGRERSRQCGRSPKRSSRSPPPDAPVAAAFEKARMQPAARRPKPRQLCR